MSSIYPTQVPFEIETDVIYATNRKLKAIWTREAQEDLRILHNLQAADELADILAKEITEEIDREILEDLRNNIAEEEYRKKNKKKKILPRSITDEWEVSRFD